MIQREIGCEKIEMRCVDCGLAFVQRRYPSVVFRAWIRCAFCTTSLWASKGNVVRRIAA